MAIKPKRFSAGGSVVDIGAAAAKRYPPSDADTTTGDPDSDIGGRIEKANTPPEGLPKPRKKPVKKMRGGVVKKMRGGGVVKKMRGGGMVKKMRGGGMVKKK